MAFTLPEKSAAAYPEQAEAHQADIAILVNGFNKCGVLGVNDGIVASAGGFLCSVAAGFVDIQGQSYAIVPGNVTITVDGSNPRYSLVVVDATGVPSVISGTPAANPDKPAVPSNVAVLAEVFTPASAPAVTGPMIIDKRIVLNTPFAPETLTRVDVIGHSLMAEVGASQVSFGSMHRLAQLSPARFRNLAVGFACVCVPGTGGKGSGSGIPNVLAGWGWIYDQYRNTERTTGINTTLSAPLTAPVTAGTSVAVASSAGAVVNVGLCMVGRGASAELVHIQSVPDGTHVTFTEALVNNHSTGEPVVAVPDAWHCGRGLVLIEYDWNDLAWMGPTTFAVAFPHAMRAVIARARECAMFEDDSVLCRITSGSFSAQTPGAGFASGGKHQRPGAAGAQFTLDIPPLEAGMAVVLHFITDANGDGALWTISVNGGAGITHDTRNINAYDYAGTRAANGKSLGSVKILRAGDGIAAGTNTITVTATTLQGNGGGFDGFGIIGLDLPPLVLERPNRLYKYFYVAPLYTPTDADQPTIDTIVQNLVAEFTPTDPTMITVEKDSILAKDFRNFIYDGAHNNDRGHALVGYRIAQALNSAVIPLRNVMLNSPLDARTWEPVTPAGFGGGVDFKTNWANFPLAGATPAAYTKDIVSGRVDLRGEIYHTSATDGAQTTIFTLPPGHRPALQVAVFAQTLYGAVSILIQPTGDVVLSSPHPRVPNGTNSGWISLAGISFLAEA